MPVTETTETAQTTPDDILTPEEFAQAFGLSDSTQESTSEPEPTASAPEPPSQPEASAAPAATVEPVASADPVQSDIDTLLTSETTPEPTTAAVPADQEKAIQELEPKIQYYESLLAKADPMVNPDGSKLEDYKVGESEQSLYSLSKTALNDVLGQLRRDGQEVLANDLVKAYDKYHENKALLDANRKLVLEKKEQLELVKEQVAWAKTAEAYKSGLKKHGIEITREQEARVDAAIQARHQNQPESVHLDKHKQISDALVASGVLKELREALKQPPPDKAPDANVKQKTVTGGPTVGATPAPPDGYDFTESQVRAMSRAEFDKNEAAIDRAQQAGRYWIDV